MSRKDALLEWIRWLEEWAQQLDSLKDSDRFKASRNAGGWQYQANCLVECWQLSLQLRSLHGLQKAVHRAITLVLPAPLAEAIVCCETVTENEDTTKQASRSASTLPSAWTLQRAKARIDVAYMLYTARQNSLPGSIAVLAEPMDQFPSWAFVG